MFAKDVFSIMEEKIITIIASNRIENFFTEKNESYQLVPILPPLPLFNGEEDKVK